MSEKYQIKNPFTVRLSDSDFEFVNENIGEFIIDIEPENLNNRNVFMKIFNLSISKNQGSKKSLPGDLEKISVLEYEKASLLNKLDKIESEKEAETELLRKRITELTTEKTDLEEKQSELLSRLNELSGITTEYRDKLENLQDEKKVIIELSPSEFAVTEAFRMKLQQEIKKPVTTGQMLFDLFWKYVTRQDTQIAFPFYLSRQKIKQLIQDNQE